MPHTFPEVAFQSGECVDPDALNAVFQEAAGKLGGRINEHDVSTDIKAKGSVESEAYYDAHQIVRAVDPGLNDAARVAAGHRYADIDGTAGDPVATVADTEGWQALVDNGAATDMSLTLTTGDDILVMFAQLQHFAWKGSGSAADEDVACESGSPLRLQYALRVDGALLDDTITGAAVYPDEPPQQWYRAKPSSSAAHEYDYRHIQYLSGTTGISCAAHPVRVTRSLPVTAGSHVVEVVARRLPPADYKVDNSYEGATVQVFNRRLFVLRIKGVSPHTGDAPAVNITAFEDGQVVAAADITTNAFTRLSAATNGLTNGHLERGVFRNEHLPRVTYGLKAQPITPGSPTTVFTGVYPGYGLDSAAWTVINDGAGTDLAILGPTIGLWRLDTLPGLLVVIANIEVSSIIWNPNAADIQGILVLALRMTNSAGTRSIISGTEVFINTASFDPENAATMKPICTDAPLMWAVDSTQLSAANKSIARIEVVGAVWDGQNAIPVTLDARTQRGIIYAFSLTGVFL